MKKLPLILLSVLLTIALCHGQEKRYMVFEFMKVETGNTVSYMDHKDFLERIYQILDKMDYTMDRITPKDPVSIAIED
jgi:hypothetical protein